MNRFKNTEKIKKKTKFPNAKLYLTNEGGIVGRTHVAQYLIPAQHMTPRNDLRASGAQAVTLLQLN